MDNNWLMAKQNDQLTKQYLKELFKDNNDELKEWVQDKLDETFLKYRDELMTKLDKIAGMLNPHPDIYAV
jgi:hypothetical protein